MTEFDVAVGVGIGLASVCTLQDPNIDGVETTVGFGVGGGLGVAGCVTEQQ